MSSTEDKIVALLKSHPKYELLPLPSNQGMNSYTFVSRHRPLGATVFLKVYDIDPASAEVFAEARYLSEATAGSGPGADHLVKILDAELLDKDLGLVAMEYLAGGDVLTRVKSTPFPQMDAVRIAIGICHGVGRLHACDLVHRDIKPANIILTNSPLGLMPKVADFGSVARLSPKTASVTASRLTPLYVPPEGWKSPSSYTKKSDMYQCGLVLHELLSGALPEDEESYLDRKAISEMREHGVSSLNALDGFTRSGLINRSLARLASAHKTMSRRPSPAYVSRALRVLINKATCPDPNGRFEGMADLIGALLGVSLPNWHLAPSGIFRATHWRGFDWEIDAAGTHHRKRGLEFIIRRARSRGGVLRKFATATSLKSAFLEIERK